MNHPQPPRPFARVLVVLAALVLVLAGLRAGATFLNPILFALVFSMLFAPVYAWFQRRGLHRGLALLLTMLLQAAVFGTLAVVVSVSLNQFVAQLRTSPRPGAAL